MVQYPRISEVEGKIIHPQIRLHYLFGQMGECYPLSFDERHEKLFDGWCVIWFYRHNWSYKGHQLHYQWSQRYIVGVKPNNVAKVCFDNATAMKLCKLFNGFGEISCAHCKYRMSKSNKTNVVWLWLGNRFSTLHVYADEWETCVVEKPGRHHGYWHSCDHKGQAKTYRKCETLGHKVIELVTSTDNIISSSFRNPWSC